MKKQTIASVFFLAAFAAMSASGQIYDYDFISSLPTDIDWDNILWNATETNESRDRYYLNIINSESANVYIRGGESVDLIDGACMYLQNDTRLVIGDANDSQTSSLHFVTDGTKDTFLEITGRSSVVVNKNGVLSIDAHRPIRWWAVSNGLPDDFESFVADGGTVNGNFGIGVNMPNVGQVNVVFRNGATLNRNFEVNPLGMNGAATLVFDNSTYNVYNPENISYNSQGNITNYGWGNHVMNMGADNQDYRQTVTITNGSVLNGAGDVEGGVGGEVMYWDFSGDITSDYNTNQKAADLTLQIGRATSEESCFTFQILNGSKVSAKNIHFGSNDATRGQHAMGAFTFEMRGEEGNIAMLAGSGATNMNLARINDSSWSNNFLLKGYAKYQTAYGFNLGYNENCGGTGNFILSGENNVFQAGGNWNINGGQNAPDSDAAINISTENASNSSISVNGVNVFSGGNSQINVNIAGGTNTFSITNGDFNMYSSRYEGDSSAVFTISIPEFESTKNFRLTNRMSGGQRLVFANGVNAEINSANFTGSNISGGSANSYYVIEGGSTLTVVGDSGYNSQDNVLASGEVGFLIRGEGSSLIHKGQMNIAPGNHGNVGGVYAIRLHGANGVFEAQKNLHMSGLFEGADAMYLLEMLGSGNTANIHTLNLGNNNSTAGAYRVYSKSDSAENKNAIYLTSTEVHLQASVVEGSTARREFIMAGNTILRTSAGGGATIKILEFAGVDYLGGETLFEVRGSGNDALFNGLYLGNGVGTAGTGTFRIAGGGSKIACSYLRVMGGASTSFENPSGGILEYRLDDTGISALQVDGGFNGYLNGLLVVDFTGMQGGYENERFVLMSANANNLEDYISGYWYDFLGESALDNMRIITRGVEDESYSFAVEDSAANAGYKDFVVYYTGSAVIPEPASCAAAAGLIALALAIYKKRRLGRDS